MGQNTPTYSRLSFPIPDRRRLGVKAQKGQDRVTTQSATGVGIGSDPAYVDDRRVTVGEGAKTDDLPFVRARQSRLYARHPQIYPANCVQHRWVGETRSVSEAVLTSE
jgi:hypothetical protein